MDKSTKVKIGCLFLIAAITLTTSAYYINLIESSRKQDLVYERQLNDSLKGELESLYDVLESKNELIEQYENSYNR